MLRAGPFGPALVRSDGISGEVIPIEMHWLEGACCAGRLVWVESYSANAPSLSTMLTRRVFFALGESMEYTKPALTYEQQADKLIGRGMQCDRDALIRCLKSVSYYRLSGYWFPFRTEDSSFREGTTLAEIWRRYAFDRRLRLIVLDAIERVEICIRTELVYRLAHAQGPFGYLDSTNLPGLQLDEHAKFVLRLKDDYGNSQEQFIKHFKGVYGDSHELPPYWMIAELMAFGTLLRLYRGSPQPIKREIADRFGVNAVVMQSWLKTLNIIRNICAHHGRLWNRELGFKPMIPNKDARWHEPVVVTNNRIFGVLSILKYMLDDVAPQSDWTGRLLALLDDYSDLPREHMGFPEDWRHSPIWK